MTRKDLAREISKQTNLTFRQAENLVIAFGAVVGEALSKGEKIVYSNFGTFYTVHYPSKTIYHPKLGIEKKMVMLPTNAVKWMPSPNIKELAKNEIVVDDATVHGARKSFNYNSAHIPEKQNSLNANQNTEKKSEDEEKEEIVPINLISKTKAETNNEPKETIEIAPVIHTQPEAAAPSVFNKPVSEEKPEVNIYEELMKDGSKEEATFGDAIRVHKDRARSFFGRMFKKTEDIDTTALPKDLGDDIKDPDADAKISLVDSGVFKKETSSIPIDNTQGAARIENIKSEIKNTPAHNPTIKTEPTDETREITPFSKEKAEISFVDLSKTIVPKEILQKIPEKLARRYKLVPIEETENILTVAMVDPQDIEAKELIKKQVQKTIMPRLASEEDINAILDQYNGLETEVKEAIKTANEEKTTSENEEEKSVLVESVSDNAPASRIVTSILRRAVRDKASDVHIEPSEGMVEVRFRLDGVLKKKISLPKDIEAAVVSRIKILSDMKIDEQRLPQDGRFSINFENRRVDFRVSTMPVANGEKIVMRVLDKMTGILTIEELGIRGSSLETLKENIEKSHGMTLVTGPTGSGKTTTLYALIDKLYSEGVNIVTLEDPIEYRMPGVNQSQVNSEIDYTFASGLRSIVRQDPDIIMIGEIRDKETAEMAVHAALTGHIVLSTLHTNDATGAAPRLIDMGVEPFLLTSALNVVVGQRLARKICAECKEEVDVSDIERKKIEEEIEKMPEKEKVEAKQKELKFFHGKGCKSCNDTGFKGRIGLYEVFSLNEKIKEIVLSKQPASVIQEEAIKNGMITMLQDGILKAIDGVTTLEEVWRVTKE